MARMALTLVLLATLAGCRNGGDGDADADADVDADVDQELDADGDGQDEPRIQLCQPEGDAGDPAVCAPDATCCTDPDGLALCCVAPRTECDPGVGCREPCDPVAAERCAEVGDGGAMQCSPEGDGILVCHAASPCWSVLLEPCEAGTCHVEGGEPVCL